MPDLSHAPHAPTPPDAPALAPLVRWCVVAVVVFTALAVAAGVDDGQALDGFDRAISRWVIDRRTGWLDDAMIALTDLGNGAVLLAVGIFLGVIVAPQHRALGLTVAIVPIVRPLLVTVLKELVDRDRPWIEPLADAAGASFPSGHVVAASMWFLLPIVLSVLRPGSRAVPATTIGAVVIVVVVAISRVYLGVHWATDTIGGALIGGVLIAGVWAVRQRPIELPAEPPLDEPPANAPTG